jgi:hypothetical protein
VWSSSPQTIDLVRSMSMSGSGWIRLPLKLTVLSPPLTARAWKTPPTVEAPSMTWVVPFDSAGGLVRGISSGAPAKASWPP